MRLLAYLSRLFCGRATRDDAPPLRRSEPLRIPCEDVGSVPPVAELQRLAVVGRHVVLQFPPSFEAGKRGLIERLAPLLPNHSVFDSGPGTGGTTCVTALKVIDEQVVLDNLSLFLRAVRDFTQTAGELARGLAAAHGVPAADLYAQRDEIEAAGEGRFGDWEFGFHGFECRFEHTRTGQVLEVRIQVGDEFGLLDPYFLAKYIRTSPEHGGAARLILDDFHDAARMLDVLHARGYLKAVEVRSPILGGMMVRGLALDGVGGRAS